MTITLLLLFWLCHQALATELDTDELEIESVSRIFFIEGLVSVKEKDGTAWDTAEVGQTLAPGDSLKTGEDSRATVKLANSSVCRIKELTEFLIPPDRNTEEKCSVIEIITGILWAKAKKTEDSLTINTPNSVCGVRGTEFTVDAMDEDATEINVLDGEVEVKSKDPKFSATPLRLQPSQGTMIQKNRAPLMPWKVRMKIQNRKFKDFEKIRSGNLLKATRNLLVEIDSLEQALENQ
ncbi:MAG: FecR family protein [Candidatus Wallbacteria bacterium]|nr:FecR family protein [Candidatus Wallbacteria bacterium]